MQFHKRLSQLENAFWWSNSLGIVFSSEISALARSWTRKIFISAGLFFKTGKSQKWQYGDLHCSEEGGCSDGSDWTLAADLLDDFGQNCSCMI